MDSALMEQGPSNSMSLDGRIAPRHVFESRILVRLCRGNQKLALHGWARNLSESGLGAFVAQGLVVGEALSLEIPLSTSGKQVIPAVVTRQLGTLYGFQFTALSAEQRSSRLLKNDFSLVVTSTYWITGCEQSQYIVVAQGAERVFQQPASIRATLEGQPVVPYSAPTVVANEESALKEPGVP